MALIIVADVLLLIIIALALSVTVSVYLGDSLRVVVKYAGITIFSLLPENEQKPKKKKKKKDKKNKKKKEAEKPDSDSEISEKSNEESEKGSNEKNGADSSDSDEKIGKHKKEKKDLSETMDLIKLFAESAGKPARRLFKGIRLTNLILNITAAGDDAAKAALNYGKINWATQSVLGFLYEFITLKVKQVNISADFLSEEMQFETSFKLKLRVGTAIGCAIWFLFRIVRLTLAKKKGIQSKA